MLTVFKAKFISTPAELNVELLLKNNLIKSLYTAQKYFFLAKMLNPYKSFEF